MNNEQKPMTASEKAQWLAIHKEAALKIDPETAEVALNFGFDLDPYGLDDLPEEYQWIGRLHWARSTESDVWVNFRDLPDDVREKLCEKHRARFAFPAGVEMSTIASEDAANPVQLT